MDEAGGWGDAGGIDIDAGAKMQMGDLYWST